MRTHTKLFAVFAAAVMAVGVGAMGTANAEPSPKKGAKTPPSLTVGKQVKVSEPTAAQLKNGSGLKANAAAAIVPPGQVNLAFPINYCSQNSVVSRTHNAGSEPVSVQIDLVQPGVEIRSKFVQVAPGDGFVKFTGVYGAYDVKQLVWDGTTYAQDEVRAGNMHTCKVVATAECSSLYPGYVHLTYHNLGTAYATVQTQRITPGPQLTAYDYPGPDGGDVLHRYLPVGVNGGGSWAVAVHTLRDGSQEAPYYFSGNCGLIPVPTATATAS